MEEEEALESDEWLEERARVYENLAADYEKAAATGRAPPNERTYEQLGIIMPRPTPAERAARIPYYLEQATKWHAEAAKWRARAAERRASLQRRLAQVPKTAEERAA